ncbi:RNA polymerase sigma factor ShbA [Amycolatopsis sp.]|jgi:RNA polymerase sigma-70 factor (ECF subfamily)|uniref:RNA polymerase sigma factor ShbA n=1 Tax=Amycolatopsis sp. TaxID=37632 RepID=UPI002E00DB73|nr:RNA polymerase sigma factor ShbA [Amycolatopsis sp.]
MSVTVDVARTKPARAIAETGLTKHDLDALVQAAAAGDRVARDRCFVVIMPMVQRYCRARMGNRDVATQSPADVAQEVCIAAFKALPRYQDNGGSFAHLVYAIAANKVADAYRAASRDKSSPVDELPEISMLTDGPENLAMAADLKVRMARLLATLPDVQREVLTLRITVGLSANEAAEALNLSPVHVRVIQHRALARLRAVMAADPEL